MRMSRGASVAVMLFLAVPGALGAPAQIPAPHIAIECTVDYGFMQAYSKKSDPPLRVWDQGDGGFAVEDMFVSRRGVTLHVRRDASTGRYAFTVDGNRAAFLTGLCREEIGEIIEYIRTNQFPDEWNRFSRRGEDDGEPSGEASRPIGSWDLRSRKRSSSKESGEIR